MPRPSAPCDIVPKAEQAGLAAAASAANRRSAMSIVRRMMAPTPQLVVRSGDLARWLFWDGRVDRCYTDGHVRLRLTSVELPGLAADDALDGAVHDAYVSVFAQVVTDAGYTVEIVVPRRSSAGSTAAPRRDD